MPDPAFCRVKRPYRQGGSPVGKIFFGWELITKSHHRPSQEPAGAPVGRTGACACGERVGRVVIGPPGLIEPATLGVPLAVAVAVGVEVAAPAPEAEPVLALPALAVGVLAHAVSVEASPIVVASAV